MRASTSEDPAANGERKRQCFMCFAAGLKVVSPAGRCAKPHLHIGALFAIRWRLTRGKKSRYSRRFLKLLVISFGLRHIHLLCVYAVQSFPRSLHEHFHSLLHCCDGSNGAEQTTRDARPIRLCRAVGNHLGGASRLFLHRFHSQPMGRNEAVLQVKKRRTFL